MKEGIMNKIKQIFICYPGGNITAIVKDRVPRELQPAVAQKIMEIYNQKRSKTGQIEQIAFEEKPINKKGLSRLQLAGGEFSGNATLCFAFLKLGFEKNLKKPESALFEISGAKSLLKSIVYPNGLINSQMPIPRKLDRINLTKEGFRVISLRGITQIVVNKFYDQNGDFQKKKAIEIIKNNNLKSKLATGVLFIKKTGKKIKMKPYVYFKKGLKYKLYKETACGSGSTAVGVSEFFLRKTAIKNLEIIQPTGSSILVKVKKQDGQLKARIKSRVKILYQGSLSLLK